MSLTKYSEDLIKRFESKLKTIQCVLFDVDGILTDGRVIFMGGEVGWNRFFNVYDGHGLKLLKENNFKVGIISGGDSLGLHERFVENLGLDSDMCFFGNEDKTGAYAEIKEKHGLSDNQVCYLGDELFDIPVLKQVGFSATVPESSFIVQREVDYITEKNGGKGAAREVIDMILLAQGILQ